MTCCAAYVCFWPLADSTSALHMSAFEGKADVRFRGNVLNIFLGHRRWCAAIVWNLRFQCSKGSRGNKGYELYIEQMPVAAWIRKRG
jgi:hypothetical protein